MAPVTTVQIQISKRSIRFRFNAWTAAVLIVAVLAFVPIAAVLGMAMAPTDGVWDHLSATVLPQYVRTTLLLMTGVGIGTFIVGTGTAWLITVYRLPGRQILEWALLLPLAMPAYVVAYVYTDILEFAGPIQGLLRHLYGWKLHSDYWFPDIRSLGGAITVMTLVLYPYVYLLARAAFLDQAAGVVEVSRSLGHGPWRTFCKVSLPMARPSIVVGISLCMMEALNDFGTVDFFAVPTFTTGIFDVWLNMGSASGAAQMASVLLIFVLALVIVERAARRGRRYYHSYQKAEYEGMASSQTLTPKWRAAAFVACVVPIVGGFLIPAGLLVTYALRHYQVALQPEFSIYAGNSLMLSGLAALVAVMVGTFLAYGTRLHGGRIVLLATRVASLGYAVPGAVLAIGVILPTALLDNTIDAWSQSLFGIPTGLLISGTVMVVVIGYVVRFLALSYGAMEAGLARITPNMDGAARTLGAGPGRLLLRVHLPLLRASLLTAGLLVFVDCMKELPMTMILRPFNFETLATFVHQYAMDERLEESAPGALAIVIAGILPVILLSRTLGARLKANVAPVVGSVEVAAR